MHHAERGDDRGAVLLDQRRGLSVQFAAESGVRDDVDLRVKGGAQGEGADDVRDREEAGIVRSGDDRGDGLGRQGLGAGELRVLDEDLDELRAFGLAFADKPGGIGRPVDAAPLGHPHLRDEVRSRTARGVTRALHCRQTRKIPEAGEHVQIGGAQVDQRRHPGGSRRLEMPAGPRVHVGVDQAGEQGGTAAVHDVRVLARRVG